MTKRQFDLIALALLVTYFAAYYFIHRPACKTGQRSLAGFSCQPPHPRKILEPRPGGGFVAMLSRPSRAG
jgi:hypothetical protein